MRLLAINPNTSQAVTDSFVAEARRVAPNGVVVDGATGRFGAAIVTTEAENVIAGHSALDLIARHAAGYDGVILAISFDTALQACEEVLPVPAVGITRAALDAATGLGRSIGVVVFGGGSQPLYERSLRSYGVTPVGWDATEVASTADYVDTTSKDRAVAAAAGRLATQGAEAVVVCGAAIVGMAARLSGTTPVPLYDGATSVAMCLERIAAARPKVAPRPLAGSVGLDDGLARLIAGDWRRGGGA